MVILDLRRAGAAVVVPDRSSECARRTSAGRRSGPAIPQASLTQAAGRFRVGAHGKEAFPKLVVGRRRKAAQDGRWRLEQARCCADPRTHRQCSRCPRGCHQSTIFGSLGSTLGDRGYSTPLSALPQPVRLTITLSVRLRSLPCTRGVAWRRPWLDRWSFREGDRRRWRHCANRRAIIVRRRRLSQSDERAQKVSATSRLVTLMESKECR